MLESLLDIEVAYSLLKSGDQADGKDLIDSHYDKLNTKIEVRRFHLHELSNLIWL